MDMDSMFVLPLNIIPLETPALHNARMIKNVRLQSVIEVFRDHNAGSGQIGVEALPVMLGWKGEKGLADLTLLRKLAVLPSYDVYSLRISLREHGIPVNDHEALRLSPEKAEMLSRYMVRFTHPLVKLVFADDSIKLEDFDDILDLFRDPDVGKARERLENLARALGIPVFEVPRFLEDYGDTFLSLSYYRHCLDRLQPYFTACLDSLEMIRTHHQLKRNPNLMKVCKTVEDVITSVSASVAGRLEVFERRTQTMWDNVSQEEFRGIKAMIQRYHITIGAALCGLTVKMNAFACIFPHPQAGGPVKRGDFMGAEMIQGIELIRDVERQFKD
jgi:hypothetical protein